MVKAQTIEDLSALLEADLKDVLDSRRMALYRMMSYHLGWEDERGNARHAAGTRRSHGVACLAACRAVGGDTEVALPAATSVELIDAFCQVHDDVQGGNPRREDRDAVWWVWGPAQAINAGDGLHALARLALFRLQERGVPAETTFKAVQLVDEASLGLCEGRFQDLEAQERIDLSVDAYLDMASGKTGSLYSCAMKLGALVASADDAVMRSFGVCGAKIGLAVQVGDDLRAFWSEGREDQSPNPEVLNKKKLLPVVYALDKASISEKRRLGEVYFKRVLEPDDVPAIRRVLEELGAREYCEDLVRQYRRQAAEAVETSLPPEGVAAVNELLDWLLDS